MTHFVDTSALVALLSATDRYHSVAATAWTSWLAEDVRLVTSNYVVTETTALVQNRIGFDAVTALYGGILPVLQVEWIDATLHSAAAAIMMSVRQRRLSLVDCTSFELMRRLGLRTVFGFDQHFIAQGFACLPSRGDAPQ